jgi:hypothetical protein
MNPTDGCEANLTNNVNDCGACGTACGSPPDAAGVSCVASKCTLTCDSGFYNQDGVYQNGCECAARPLGAGCGADLVSSPAVVSGRMLGATTQWLAVSFPNENGKCGEDYTLQLVNNGNPIVMNVYQNCSLTGVSCDAAGDVGSNYTTWQMGNDGSQCTVTYPSTFYVQVVATGTATSCMDFSVVSSSP